MRRGPLFLTILLLSTIFLMTRLVAAAPNTSDRVVIKVRGMMCGSCSLAVKRALFSLPGIGVVTVDLPRDLVTVSYDRSRATVPQMVEVIRKAGYRAEPPP